MQEFNDDTIYILDSYGLIYRCYFAFISRPLTNSRGENISALFGFFRNLHAVFTHYKPRCIAAAFDSRTPTFRHEMYDEYKATRAKTPDDLHAQIPWIEDILASLGIPILQCDGYEADDIIATVAAKAAASGRTCRILSGDKDLMQLVNGTTQILKPDTALIWKAIDSNGVKAEWGVLPEQMLDLLSLIGDASDNVPGVKGVGPKTACKYIDAYGNLDNIFAHADEIKGAAGEKLRAGKDDAYFSQKLIKLCYDVPCVKNLEDAIPPVSFDFNAAAEKLSFYEAPTVAKSYAALAAENGKAQYESSEQVSDTEEVPMLKPLTKNKGEYRAVTDIEELKKIVDGIIASKEKCAAFDCETDSLDTMSASLVGFSLCTIPGKAVYVPLVLTDALFSGPLISKQDALAQIARLFTDKDITVVMHNGKFDYEVLRTNGIALGGGDYPAPSCKIADTMVAAWLLDPDKTGGASYALEYLAEKNLSLSGIEYDDIVPKGGSFADVPLDKAADYGAEDADFTLQLWHLFRERLEKNKLLNLFTDVEMKLLPILAEMELRGIHVNTKALDKYDAELTGEIETVQKEIYEIVGHEFNIASPKQLQEILFEELKLPHGKKTKTGYSTDTTVLEELSAYHPVPQKILTYREKTKLQSTYVEALPKLCDKNKRLHTNYMQTGTATGRLSSRDPNLQNIPVRNEDGRRIRSAFTALPNTHLISADYSQIELVVLAHLSGDKNMCKAFSEGVDIHRATASLLFSTPPEKVTADERRVAKTINFGIIYGMSAFRLARDLGISRTQAASFIENYFTQYSSIRRFIDSTISFAETHGYVETIFGRKRKIININSKNKTEKAAAERIAVNTPVQGSAADIVKQAMLDVDSSLRKEKNGARLLLQVHDELIFECPSEKSVLDATIDMIRNKMESAVKLSVPLRVSIEAGKNWGTFH
ncbi:DNA-directed DNA polymerase [Treponema socranskii subsp. socranskii VPI DR56BR1116 = ATCC 35536]|uniref:DNA polymerase I n=1 Tax=Treponema socranskii subsp. socranskii VPI DR56BR1116 = ATCC 35536 TaxID=1125725 RepID=U1GUT0_TRESO|nr:DNA polymerase I [Treponema socranskii]ERF60359.1 DNA-directed DNA polymerase [Treponema socranskii subsp. socranskii VPI DR56BR1116 = ATCC 35536]ERJ97681.1 DNA-directed DNA polymerase [Treponema socranskii subsp. socranskii VPI DR56BR1116 = ATCC 35536]